MIGSVCGVSVVVVIGSVCGVSVVVGSVCGVSVVIGSVCGGSDRVYALNLVDIFLSC